MWNPINPFSSARDVSTGIWYITAVRIKARHRLEKEHFKTEELTKRLRGGSPPEDIREELSDMLDHYGTNPQSLSVPVASWRDGYGNAFSGKYESIFCMNQGTKEERMEELGKPSAAYTHSTMNEQAIEYRRKRHLYWMWMNRWPC